MKKDPRNKKPPASKKAKSSPKPSAKKSTENARKGKLVEAVVALLHEMPGVKVERNVFLPPIHGDQTRRREIDVLLTGNVAGYLVRIAFSCKNESKKIEPGKIGEFIDELDDVGIPPQHGIFVCVNGYTHGALDRSKEKGIRTLVLRGLTKNRLASEVAKAFQFNIFLLGEVVKITVTNNVGIAEYEGQFSLFFDDKSRPCGNIADLIVNWWWHGDPPSTLGEYHLNFDVPQGWNQFVAGKPEPVLGISATVLVRGLIITLSGKTKTHTLVDPVSQSVTRGQIRVDFDGARKRKVVLPVTTVNTEEELEAFTRRQDSVTLTSRIRLPRILSGSFYYPWSERVFRLMIKRYEKFQAGEIPDFRAFTLEETEGTDLSTAWEPPWYESVRGEGPPVIIMDDEGNSVDLRLLMNAGEYGRVAALRPKFERSRTPEFAYLLSWAYLMQADALACKAASKHEAEANRLIEQSIERIEAALQVSPDMSDAYIKLGAVFRDLGRHEDALASYDRAVALDKDDYEAWANRAVTLINLGKVEDALDSVNKSLDLAPQTGARVMPLMLRAYIHYLGGRHRDAAGDLIAAWNLNPDQVVGNVNYSPMIEAFCTAARSPETFLLLAETLWSEAASKIANGNREEAGKRAEDAAQTLEALKPNDESADMIVATVSGPLVYDVLTRSAGYLVKSGDKALAEEYIERMQSWAQEMFGEKLDSLTDFTRELSEE
ncbi:MAG: tetratricopeptide repeat protein [Pyrinomonadaceae bacterium]|nr:tetratricopeptide repeat protein [Pyrinomonadaceae bacterium]